MINKLFGFLLLVVTFLVVSCEKETRSLKEIEEQRIENYISKNNLSFEKDTMGYYYQILEQGDGKKLDYPDFVAYLSDLKALEGNTLPLLVNRNSNTVTAMTYSDTYSFTPNLLGYVKPLSFRESILKLNRGGKIRVLIPSYLAFGKEGVGTLVAGNTILDATFEVVDGANQNAVEDSLVNRYVQTLSETYTRDSTGLYYSIVNPGTGTEEINLLTSLKIAYTGKLFNGFQFDAAPVSSPFNSTLSGLIQGWQIGVPKIKSGGKIKLIIPSRLAYGNQLSGNIPPNTPLTFEIEIVE